MPAAAPGPRLVEGQGGVFTKRIFFGVVTVWVLLEGSKGLWRIWAAQRAGQAGMLGRVADGVQEVTG